MSSSGNRSDGRLLLVAALHPGALQKLAVLLLGHALAALLDDRAHRTSSQTKVGRPQRIGCSPDDRVSAGVRRAWSLAADRLRNGEARRSSRFAWRHAGI